MDDKRIGPQRTANYSGSHQRKLTGLEHLTDGGSVLPFHIAEFWQWAYSDMLRNTNRGVLAEFIVKAALELGGVYTNEDIRSNFEPYDLVGPYIEQRLDPSPEPETSNLTFIPCRIEVKSAAYVQAWEPHPGTVPRISFSIAPAKVPDEIGDFRPDAPRQRNSDLYVFAIYTATRKRQNIFDMDLWRFYVIKTSVLNESCGDQKTISLVKLQTIGSPELSFKELCQAIKDACESITADNRKDHPVPDGLSDWSS